MERMRRSILYAGALLVLAGCSKNRDSTSVPDHPPDATKELTVSHPKHAKLRILAVDSLVEGERRFLEKSIQAYQFHNPSIQIDIDDHSNQNNEINDTATLIKEQRYPATILKLNRMLLLNLNVALQDERWCERYLVDFSNDPKVAGQHVEVVREIWRQSYATEHMVLGPTLDTSYPCIWMNTDLAEAIGFTPFNQGLFLDYKALKQAALNVEKWNASHDVPLYLFSTAYSQKDAYIIFMHLLHSRMSDKDGNVIYKDRDRLNQSIKHALTDLKPLIPVLSLRWVNKKDRFTYGQTLFGVRDCSDYRALCNKMGEEKVKRFQLFLGVAHKPYNGVFGHYQPSYVVLKGAPNEAEAREFIQFLCQPQQIECWLRETMRIPGMKLKFFDPGFTKDPYGKFVKMLETQSHHGRISPINIIRHNLDYTMGRNRLNSIHVQLAILQFVRGEKSQQDVYQSLMQHIEQSLAID